MENKPEILALNKIDALNDELVEDQAKKLEAVSGKRPLLVSGATGRGVQDVLGKLYDIVRETRKAAAAQEALTVSHGSDEDSEGWTP